MAKPKKFPEHVYVSWFQDEDYMVVLEDPSYAEDGDRVGIYKLVDIKTKRIRSTLE